MKLVVLLTLLSIGIQCLNALILIPNTRKYITLRSKLNGIQNISYALSSKTKLLPLEKQALLDMHNSVRNKLAKGEEHKSMGGRMPVATNMLAMEWEDILADWAQKWADTCPDGHSTMKITHPNYKLSSFAENLSGGLVAIDRDMYGEVKDWNYHTQQCRPSKQCGHYLALAAWGNFRMGCGWQVCKKGAYDKYIMVCLFAPYSSAGIDLSAGTTRRHYQYEYWNGTQPCTACPQGWDYCMGGGLCATKAQCDSDSSNNCVCTHDAAQCAANGGTFDASKCRCKCPANKYGRNCANDCKETAGMMECGGDSCWNSMEAHFLCYKSCGSCGTDVSKPYRYWMRDRKAHNKDNVKVRSKAPSANVATDIKTALLPGRGSCKNRESDYFCEQIRARKYCKDAMDGAKWRHFCASSCNSCNDTEFAKMAGLITSGTPVSSASVPWTPVSTGDVSSLLSGWGSSSGSSGGWAPTSSGSTPTSSGWASSGWTPTGSSTPMASSSAPASSDSGWSSSGWAPTGSSTPTSSGGSDAWSAGGWSTGGWS